MDKLTAKEYKTLINLVDEIAQRVEKQAIV